MLLPTLLALTTCLPLATASPFSKRSPQNNEAWNLDTAPAGTIYRGHFVLDPSCTTPDLLPLVQQAIDDANSLASGAINMAADSAAFRTYMDATGSTARLNKVNARMTTMALLTDKSVTDKQRRKRNLITRLRCDVRDYTTVKDNDCKTGAWAFVSDIGFAFQNDHGTSTGGAITLCGQFFHDTRYSLSRAVQECQTTDPNKDITIYTVRNPGYALIHEMAHLWQIVERTGAFDCYYGPAFCRNLARDLPDIALVNADNYGYMALHSYLSKSGSCNRLIVGHQGEKNTGFTDYTQRCNPGGINWKTTTEEPAKRRPDMDL